MAAEVLSSHPPEQPAAAGPAQPVQGTGLRALGVALVVLAVVPVLLLLALAWQAAQARMAERARGDLASVAELIASGQEQWVEGTRQLLLSVGQAPVVVAGDWAACNAYLQRLGARMPQYVALGVVDVEGHVVCRSSAQAGPASLGDRPYVQRALRLGEFSSGDYMVGRITGGKTVPFALPVFGAGGAVRGAVFVGLDLKYLHERLGAVPLPAGVSAAVADSKGVVLASSRGDFAAVGTPLANPSLRAAVTDAAPGGFASQDAGGEPQQHHVSLVPVAPGARLFVTVSASTSELLAPATHDMRVVIGAILGFLLLYGAMIVALGARWIVQPLRQLAHSMRLIERGRFEPGAAPHGSVVREVRELQRGLHTMWAGLRRRSGERDEALASSDAARAEMHTVLDRLEDAFMILDGGWRVKFCNRCGTELVAAAGEPAGQLFWDLFPDEKWRARRARCEKEVGEGRVSLSEDFHARYGRWLEIRFFPSADGIGVVVRDATERFKMTNELLEREQRYRELFEANPNVMWIFDVETLKFLAVNQAAINRYGYSREEFLAMDITGIRPAEDREEVQQEVQRSLRTGGATLGDNSRIWRHVTRSGEVILVEVARHQISFENRLARLVMVTDATARLVSESRLRTRLEKLSSQYSQADSALMASRQIVLGQVGVVHEEVLPLLARVVALGDRGAARAGELELLGAEATRAAQLLGEVMRLSQVPRAPLRPEPLDLALLAQDELDKLQARDPQRRVQIEIDPQLECEGDPALLVVLMQALLDNAWKFTSRQPQAWIRVGRLERPGGPPGFYVSDNGIGLDESQQARIYMPFERLHSGAEYPGHGLGLALARAVVVRHGGRLWARSTPGQGATFCFELQPQPEDSLSLVSEVVIDSPPELADAQ